MEKQLWALLCSYFEVSHSFFIKGEKHTEVEQWDLLSAHKCWSSSVVRQKQTEFLKERQSLEGVLWLSWFDPIYPTILRSIDEPPICLFYKGPLELLSSQCLSVIGSRRLSMSFLYWMEQELGLYLSKNAITVVSGGAFGVDQMALKIALREQRGSVVVLPSGLRNMYPSYLENFQDEKDVLFITEYFPSKSMRKYHFIKRNRLIAGLSQHLFVVQCAQKSGSMMTVRYALDLGRSVATVPDFPGAMESGGNLKLIKDGCSIVCNAQDLQDFMRWPALGLFDMTSPDK